VADVESIRADWGRLGFAATATGICRWTLRGRSHAARASSVVFERAYLDLIEMPDYGWARHLEASPAYAKRIVPSGVVLAPASLERTRSALSARGIEVGELYEIVRELPGAEPPEIRYRIFSLREPDLPFSFIEDAAPGAMRTPAWLRHPNSATGIRCVHLRAPSSPRWLDRLALLFDGRSSQGAREVDLGTTLLLHDDVRDPYLAELSALLPRREHASLLAIEISVVDLHAAREALHRSGVPASDLDGGIAVEPGAGYGCGIVFGDAHRPTRCCE
jgi:hypothetical protein